MIQKADFTQYSFGFEENEGGDKGVFISEQFSNFKMILGVTLVLRFPKPCPRAVRLPKSSSARTRIHTRALKRARRPLIRYALSKQSRDCEIFF